jgi:16S rRNA processing protein RimM
VSRVRIGRIVGFHGLRGTLRIKSLTDFPERFDVGATVFLKGNPLKITEAGFHRGLIQIKLEGITDRTAAEAFRNEYLEAEEEERSDLEEGEFITADLIGLKVVDAKHGEIGKVDNVMLMPAHEMLEVGKVLIPLVAEFVESIDFEKGVIHTTLIDGMIDLN